MEKISETRFYKYLIATGLFVCIKLKMMILPTLLIRWNCYVMKSINLFHTWKKIS